MAGEGGHRAGVDRTFALAVHDAAGVDAVAANPAEDDAVANGDLAHAVASRQHRRRGFVAEQVRQETVLAALAARLHQLAVADAGVMDADQHLAGAQRRNLDVLLDAQRGAGLPQYRGAEGARQRHGARRPTPTANR